jgi:hypothetical protein
MIGVFVTLRYRDNFDEQAIRKIAETARVRYLILVFPHSLRRS